MTENMMIRSIPVLLIPPKTYEMVEEGSIAGGQGVRNTV